MQTFMEAWEKESLPPARFWKRGQKMEMRDEQERMCVRKEQGEPLGM